MWLKKWQEPWNIVFTKWQKSFQLRKNNKSSTVEEFITEWPILRHKDVFLLVCNVFSFHILIIVYHLRYYQISITDRNVCM